MAQGTERLRLRFERLSGQAAASPHGGRVASIRVQTQRRRGTVASLARHPCGDLWQLVVGAWVTRPERKLQPPVRYRVNGDAAFTTAAGSRKMIEVTSGPMRGWSVT
ncbi:MAG TPA: hypothetical protein VEQ37_18645 [Actinomycetota bacterium]|nr:hypothetical protein [Actinomycetota bacterium]